MKNTILFIFALVITVCSCSNEESQSNSDLSKRTQNALIEADEYYRSEKAWNASPAEINQNIEGISKKYGVKITPLSYDQYHELFQASVSFAKVACVCCGTVTHTEYVDEGGGCFGIVRQYANGSSSISAYCNNGATFEGYYCYE